MTKIYRSRTDKKLFGLCGGLAEKFNVDPTLLRLVVVVTAFFSGGTVIAVYVIAAMVIPLEPDHGSMSSSYGWDEQPFYGMKPAAASSRGPSTSYDIRSEHAQAKTQSYTTAGTSKLDEMMKDVEQKALREELEQLRAKLARYEKGES